MKPEDLVIGDSYKLKGMQLFHAGERQVIYMGHKKDPYFNNDWYQFRLAELIELPEPLDTLSEITLWNDDIQALEKLEKGIK